MSQELPWFKAAVMIELFGRQILPNLQCILIVLAFLLKSHMMCFLIVASTEYTVLIYTVLITKLHYSTYWRSQTGIACTAIGHNHVVLIYKKSAIKFVL